MDMEGPSPRRFARSSCLTRRRVKPQNRHIWNGGHENRPKQAARAEMCLTPSVSDTSYDASGAGLLPRREGGRRVGERGLVKFRGGTDGTLSSSHVPCPRRIRRSGTTSRCSSSYRVLRPVPGSRLRDPLSL